MLEGGREERRPEKRRRWSKRGDKGLPGPIHSERESVSPKEPKGISRNAATYDERAHHSSTVAARPQRKSITVSAPSRNAARNLPSALPIRPFAKSQA